MRVFIDFPLRHASLSNGIASPQFTKNQQEVEKRSGSKIGQNLTCMFFFLGGGAACGRKLVYSEKTHASKWMIFTNLNFIFNFFFFSTGQWGIYD